MSIRFKPEFRRIKLRFSAWVVCQFVVAALCVTFFGKMILTRENYDSRMPRSARPEQGRTIPIVVAGTDPVYVTANERQAWKVVNYEGWGSLALVFVMVAFRELWKGKGQRGPL